ncbi:MAG: ABC transporter ATP-binding protein [Sneathiella sp.]
MAPDYAIECSQVSKRYSDFQLNPLDLSVPTGSVMGFVGPNGAGKSTTLRIIMGLIHQDEGEVTVLGNAMPDQQIDAKWQVGYLSEDMRLYPGQDIGFHMTFMRSIYPTWDDQYAALLLKRFNLKAEQKVKGLSHGQRVKASLLMALARHPKLLVLDEPTTGLDPLAREEILEEMSTVLLEEDRTILFSSHNTQDVEQLSDEITFINGGSLLFTKDKETLLDDWRRIRLQVTEEFSMPNIPGLMNVQQNGRMRTLLTNQYSQDVEKALCAADASVTATERLTLEEIFLASVMEKRELMQ